MEQIKRELVESGVIGRVVDDFIPRLEFHVFYGDMGIGLGDEVYRDQVQRHPTRLVQYSDASDVELREIFRNPKLVVLVMTDPDAPGGEYLHWLTAPFLSIEHATVDLPPVDLVAYEPPRSGAHMLVFTLFKTHHIRPIVSPKYREYFSTRNFATNNALGSPLGASFFTIKYESEDEKNETSEVSAQCLAM